MPIPDEVGGFGIVTGPRYPGGPHTPEWMDPGQAGGPIPVGRGQQQLFNPNETLPLFSKAATGFVLAGLLYGIAHWADPILKVTVRQKATGFWAWWSWTIAAAQKLIAPRLRQITHTVGKGAAHTAEAPARTLGHLATRWEQGTFYIAYLAHDIANAMEHGFQHKVPHEVRKGVAPVKVRQRRTETTVKRHGAQITTVRRYVHVRIERGVMPRIRKLERTVNHDLPLRIHKGEIQRGKLETRVKHDERTLAKLLPLLTVAGAVSVVLRAFTRMGLNYLKCQNMKDLGRDICASPPGSGKRLGNLLKSLLGMGAGILFASQFCRFLFLVLEGAAPVASKLVETLAVAESALCNGKYAAAPPLPLEVTANPPVPNPLVL